MTSNGWTGTEPEYEAAEVYFSQTPRPSNVVIGRQGTIATTLSAALVSGTAYTVIDVAALPEAVQPGVSITIGTAPTTQVVTASAAAAAGATVIDVNSFTANAAYAIGANVSAAETPLQAVTACRSSNTNWYACYVTGATDADIEAIAGYIQSATPLSAQFYDTQSANVASGTTPNVMSVLQANKYTRVLGIYTTSEAYAGAAIMGIAMGSNTGLANSAFSLAYKSLIGVTADNLTTQQLTNITGWNGNVYTSYNGQYDLLVQGTMADGTPFDQLLNIDALTVGIQTAVVTALTQSPKVPQTDPGVTILVNAISSVCDQARKEGVLAPGIWTAAPVLGLQTGTNLPLGFLVLADTIANQSSADRTARKSPPIYACVKMAGAIEHVVIGLVVNQ